MKRGWRRQLTLAGLMTAGTLAGAAGAAFAETGCSAAAGAMVATPGEDSVHVAAECEIESRSMSVDASAGIGPSGVGARLVEEEDTDGDGDRDGWTGAGGKFDCTADQGPVGTLFCSVMAQT